MCVVTVFASVDAQSKHRLITFCHMVYLVCKSAFQVWESVYCSVVVLEQRILWNFNFVFLLDNKIINLVSFSQASCSLNAFITTRNSLSVATWEVSSMLITLNLVWRGHTPLLCNKGQKLHWNHPWRYYTVHLNMYCVIIICWRLRDRVAPVLYKDICAYVCKFRGSPTGLILLYVLFLISLSVVSSCWVDCCPKSFFHGRVWGAAVSVCFWQETSWPTDERRAASPTGAKTVKRSLWISLFFLYYPTPLSYTHQYTHTGRG